MPAFQPYWGKPAVRNDRGDRGNVGIIRSPVRASILPDRSCQEATRGAEGEFGAAVELLAVADIYDALTAPKIYKGLPRRIVGALAELMRLPYCQSRQRPVFTAFAELMKPSSAAIAPRAWPDFLIR